MNYQRLRLFVNCVLGFNFALKRREADICQFLFTFGQKVRASSCALQHRYAEKGPTAITHTITNRQDNDSLQRLL